jgi:hypothetical protein
MPADDTTTDTTTTDIVSGSSTTDPKVFTFTQEKLDRIIGSRVAEVKSGYADYEDLKAAKSELDTLKAAQLSETERLQKERDDAKAEAETAKAAAASTLLEAQRTLVAAQAGLPEELGALLKGSTKEELQAHAETLKQYAKPAEETRESVTPEGTRREQDSGNGLTREQIAKLAKENPAEFNRKFEAGEISL